MSPALVTKLQSPPALGLEARCHVVPSGKPFPDQRCGCLTGTGPWVCSTGVAELEKFSKGPAGFTGWGKCPEILSWVVPRYKPLSWLSCLPPQPSFKESKGPFVFRTPLLPGAFKVSQLVEPASSSRACVLLREEAGSHREQRDLSSTHRAVPGTLLCSPSAPALKAASHQGTQVTATHSGGLSWLRLDSME